MFRLLKYLIIIFLLIFFLPFVILGAAIDANSTPALTKLEQSYVKDANHAVYAFVLNTHCRYMPQSKLTVVTDQTVEFAKTVVGEQKMAAFDATEGRTVMRKIAEIDQYLKSLSKQKLAKECKSHRNEFTKIYKYLVSLSDESNESVDN